MHTASEVVHYLNENSISVYDLSEQLGLGRTTLRARLKNLGYTQNAVDDWVYSGDALTEPGDEDVVSNKRMVVAKDSTKSNAMHEQQTKITIHQSLMQLNLNDQTTRTTISILDSQIKEMKELAAATRLRLSDVYSLAIAEFLNKYSNEN